MASWKWNVIVPGYLTNPRGQQTPASSATGISGRRSARYSPASPAFSGGAAPTAVRVPSGKITIGRPAAFAALPALSIARSAAAEPARSTGMTPCARAAAPHSGMPSSSALSTVAGRRNSHRIMIVSYAD